MKIQHFLAGGKNGNPALLQTTIDPVDFGQNMGVCIRSISYGSLVSKAYNIVIKFTKTGKIMTFPIYYTGIRDRLRLAQDITSTIVRRLIDLGLHGTGITVDRIEGSKYRFLVEGLEILSLPDVFAGSYDSVEGWSFQNAQFSKQSVTDTVNSELGFIYLNVAKNSFFNGFKSRIAAVVPLDHVGQVSHGYNYFEWKYPNFIKVDVKQFSYNLANHMPISL